MTEKPNQDENLQEPKTGAEGEKEHDIFGPPTTPQQQMLDIWVQNVFPDIALQSVGMRLLAEAFRIDKDLFDPKMYGDMPGLADPNKWATHEVDASRLTMNAVAFKFPLSIIVDANKYNAAATDVARQLQRAIKSPEGIVRGTVRLNTRSGDTPNMLAAELIWMGAKPNTKRE